MRWSTSLILGAFAVVLLSISLVTYKVYKTNYNIWLFDYLFCSPARTEGEGVSDIIFVVVDHWEPGGNMELVNAWMTSYRELADKHVDFDGRKLQHTWYYPLEQFRGYEVDSLVQLCCEGYGDVEVHLHHQGDNSQSLRKIFSDGLDSL